jgi:uncharacterized SAM-binding protein YcdF (DUF218 family)
MTLADAEIVLQCRLWQFITVTCGIGSGNSNLTSTQVIRYQLPMNLAQVDDVVTVSND